MNFAETLHGALANSSDDTVRRIILSRCEIDTENIKAEFEKRYAITLGKKLVEKYNSIYLLALLHLLREKPPDQGKGFGGKRGAKRVGEAPGASVGPGGTPTVVAIGDFSVKADVEIILKSLKSKNVAGMLLLGKRSWQQRLEIAKVYKDLCKKELENSIDLAFTGPFAKTMIRLIKHPLEVAARDINAAVKSSDEQCLIEIICTLQPSEMQQMKEFYLKTHGVALAKELESDSVLRKFLVNLVTKGKKDKNITDVAEDASNVRRFLEKSDSNGLALFFVSKMHSLKHLEGVVKCYKQQFETEISDDIRKHFSGDIQVAVETLVSYCSDRSKYYAELLKSYIDDDGNQKSISRLVVSRCEIDLGDVKVEFQKLFENELFDSVSSLEPDDFRQIIACLVGGNEEENKPKEKSKENIPTVFPEAKFNAKQDCENLKKAMKGLGTNEATLIDILTNRSWEQRQEIDKTYKEVIKEELEADLNSDCSGNFLKVLLKLLKKPSDLLAIELHSAIKSPDIGSVVEILCNASDQEFQELKEAYKAIHDDDLDTVISNSFSDHVQTILDAVLKRCEGDQVDEESAEQEAKDLHDAIVEGESKAIEKFAQVLTSFNYAQIQAILICYEKEFEIEKDIAANFGGEVEKLMLSIGEFSGRGFHSKA